MKDIVNFVVPDVQHKWYDLGLQLLDPRDEAFLQGLKLQYPNASDRCRAVFERWLDVSTKATWSKIMGALNERSVDLPNVSYKIESLLDKRVSYLASICMASIDKYFVILLTVGIPNVNYKPLTVSLINNHRLYYLHSYMYSYDNRDEEHLSVR